MEEKIRVAIINSYCNGITESLSQPQYTLTRLKIKRIKQQLEHIKNVANDPNL